MKPFAHCMEEKEMSVDQLVAATGLDSGVVQAIATGQYTPSPSQRQRLADALRISKDEIAWGHTVEVKHLYGHGPQFGRSP